ncbi:MAG: LytTR family DNA-binding domain-containing protein [Coriobacteriia bacterium]|nr:LytTR family DNA-binding domain-containing protein [Coriobacteriia bacterium]
MADGTVDNPVLRIAIAEDTQSDIDILVGFINDYQTNKQIRVYHSGEELLADFHKSQYDLLFLDIYMYEINGVETAERIRDIDTQVVIVFTTTSEDFTRESYRLNAYKYLVKPLVAKDVFDALELAILKRDKAQGATLAIVYENVPVLIPLNEILYIESSNRRSLVHTDDDVYTTTMTIDALAKLLPSPRFTRSHRSFVVNFDRVDEVSDDFIMDDGSVAYITVKNHRKMKRAYEDYVFNKVRSDV